MKKWIMCGIGSVIIIGCVKIRHEEKEIKPVSYPIFQAKGVTLLGDTIDGVIVGVIPPHSEPYYIVTQIKKEMPPKEEKLPPKKEMPPKKEEKEEEWKIVTEKPDTTSPEDTLIPKVEEKEDVIIIEPTEKGMEEMFLPMGDEIPELPPKEEETPSFTVQIGAFKRKEGAERLYQRMKEKYGEAIYIGQIGEFWKVRFGKYFTLEEANKAKRILQREGFKGAWVVRIKK
jgi:cell division protein FtsN